MIKDSGFRMADILSTFVQKQDTSFQDTIPVMVKVVVTLYKLCQGAFLLICSEQFAIGKSTVCQAVQEVVRAINIHFRHEIEWPRGNRLIECISDFCN